MNGKDRRTEFRERRLAKGLCARCGKVPHEPNRTGCAACLAAAAAKAGASTKGTLQRKAALKRLSSQIALAGGLCSRCKKAPVLDGGRTCIGCRKRQREYETKHRERVRRKGFNGNPARAIVCPRLDEPRRPPEPPPPHCARCGTLDGPAAHWTADCKRYAGVTRRVSLPVRGYSK